MSANKFRSLLLLTALGLGVSQSYAATTLNVWIRASNDSKNIYKRRRNLKQKPVSKLSTSTPLLTLNSAWRAPRRVTLCPI